MCRPSLNVLSLSSSKGRRRIIHRLGYRKAGFYATKMNKTEKERGTIAWGKAGMKRDRKSISKTDKGLISIYETPGDEWAKDLNGERRYTK